MQPQAKLENVRLVKDRTVRDSNEFIVLLRPDQVKHLKKEGFRVRTGTLPRVSVFFAANGKVKPPSTLQLENAANLTIAGQSWSIGNRQGVKAYVTAFELV